MSSKQKPKISISWSGGKDSALALYKLFQTNVFEIAHIHTVFNSENKRVGMHGIHEDLIQKQADLMGIPLRKLYLEEDKTTSAYENLMVSYYKELKEEGISHVMFGDIFLEDLKEFRDSILKRNQMIGVYPLWKLESSDLLHEFLHLGFESIICAADAHKMSIEAVGRPLTIDLLEMNIDPCGENGEYHSFVTRNPMFRTGLKINVKGIESKKYSFEKLNESGERKMVRSEFWFADIH